MPDHRQTTAEAQPADYRLDDQVGFVLRRASQRHLGIFASRIPDLTPTQFAALARLVELGEVSQNELGRQTAMDAATIKGVVDRLRGRGLADTGPDRNDQRRLLVKATAAGETLFETIAEAAFAITDETLAPLNARERTQFLSLLRKLV